jgi:alpha-methylacyl-CoA racemase
VKGPLAGLRVLEFAGLGPAPFACMLLSDLGAEVVRIERPGGVDPLFDAVTGRGRRRLTADLKSAEGLQTVKALSARAHCIVEGFRPGVMERLGLGPQDLLAQNLHLVYGRMTGWGQAGPLAAAAGHDINYLGLTGALHAIGPPERPLPPLNLVADFGGGALYLVVGLLAACRHAQRTGQGQIVDCAMIDGASSLLAMAWGMAGQGAWTDHREANLLDGGAPYYRTYATADGKFMAVGALEPQFFCRLVAITGVSEHYIAGQSDESLWPQMRVDLERAFASRSQADWTRLFEHQDACVTPVLTLRDAAQHPHARYRDMIAEVEGLAQPAPAPRFSETPGSIAVTQVLSMDQAHAIWAE